MTPSVVSPLIDPTAMRALIHARMEKAKLAPIDPTAMRALINARMKKAKLAPVTSAQPVKSAGTDLAAIKQLAATANPKTLTEARLGLKKIAELLGNVSAASAHVGPAAPAPTAPAQRPKIEGYSPVPTDAEHFAVYQQLKGAARFAYFNIHGAAIWRAYDRRTRSPRGR